MEFEAPDVGDLRFKVYGVVLEMQSLNPEPLNPEWLKAKPRTRPPIALNSRTANILATFSEGSMGFGFRVKHDYPKPMRLPRLLILRLQGELLHKPYRFQGLGVCSGVCRMFLNNILLLSPCSSTASKRITHSEVRSLQVILRNPLPL